MLARINTSLGMNRGHDDTNDDDDVAADSSHDGSESSTRPDAGGIQPHGTLLVVDPTTLMITQAGQNLVDHLGVPAHDVLGRPLSAAVGEEAAGRLASTFDDALPVPGEMTLVTRLRNGRSFNALLHRSSAGIVIEFEPIARSADEPHPPLRRMIRELKSTTSTEALCERIAHHVRALTQFDRVGISRFDSDGNGEVVAESRADGLPAFAGAGFPASMIPPDVRRGYVISGGRYIVDVEAEPAPVLTSKGIADGSGDGLSFSSLRAASPRRRELMHGLNARASMTLPVIHNGRLWGLVICLHHAGAKAVSHESRCAVLALVETFSLLLESKQETEDAGTRDRIRRAHDRLLEGMIRDKDFLTTAQNGAEDLLSLTGATSVALVIGRDIIVHGDAPPRLFINRLSGWLRDQVQEEVFVANRLEAHFADARGFADRAGGLLALTLSRMNHHQILWFRPEVQQSEARSVLPKDGVPPAVRNAHDVWLSVSRRHAKPWKPTEIEAARQLRTSINEIVFVRAEKLARLNESLGAANQALTERNRELQEFASIASHDLQEPLRKIRSFSTLLRDEYGSQLDETAAFYLERMYGSAAHMSELIADLLEYSRISTRGTAFEEVDLNHIALRLSDRFDVAVEEAGGSLTWAELPSLVCDAGQIARALECLIDNALKFRAQGRPIRVNVTTRSIVEGYVDIVVEDNGSGFDEKYLDRIFLPFERLTRRDSSGTGIGLAIANRIVRRHGGELSARSHLGKGSTFVLRLPASRENDLLLE